jgi:hypothetical protein
LQTIKRESLWFNFTPFVYGEQKYSDPSKLKVPIMAIKDPQAAQSFRSFKAIYITGKVLYHGGLLAVLLSGFDKNASVQDKNMTAIIGLSASVVGISLRYISMIPLDKSIARYNSILSGSKVGLSVQKIPYQSETALGIGFSKSF